MKLLGHYLSAVCLAANTELEGAAIATVETVPETPTVPEVPPIVEIKEEEEPISKAAGNKQSLFKQTLKAFVEATTVSMQKARELADMAMEHFMAHDDTVYFQAITDAIGKHANNYVRNVALVAWGQAFAPLAFVKGKWTKDKPRAEEMGWKDNKVVQAEIDGKLYTYDQISFWDFAPEKPISKLNADDLLAYIMSKVASKKLAERVEGDADAEATLLKLKQAVMAVKPVHITPPLEGQEQTGLAAA